MAAVRKNQRWQHYRSTKNITIDGMGGALGMIMYGWAGKIQFNQKSIIIDGSTNNHDHLWQQSLRIRDGKKHHY